MSNYDQQLEQYFSRVVTINYLLSTLIFPIIVYLILTKSQQMKKYKVGFN